MKFLSPPCPVIFLARERLRVEVGDQVVACDNVLRLLLLIGAIGARDRQRYIAFPRDLISMETSLDKSSSWIGSSYLATQSCFPSRLYLTVA